MGEMFAEGFVLRTGTFGICTYHGSSHGVGQQRINYEIAG